MKIRCLIVDDKPLAIDLLTEYILKTPFLELIDATTNPVSGLQLIRTHNISLVFLDIQMPQLSGIQFLKLAGAGVKIILTTAYVKYAIDGYEHDVVDYLLKPIAFDRFYQAAEKALRGLSQNHDLVGHVVPTLLAMNTYLFVKTEHRIQKINLADILYVEGLENYVSVHTISERILSLQPLKKMEEQLPPIEFVRVHRSFIIALKHVSYIERANIVLNNGTYIPIGNNYRPAFFNILNGG